MSAVLTAVKKASKASKRQGDWANKPEISAKITGKKPADLGGELRKLVKEGDIERKKGASLWRPTGGAGGGLFGGDMRSSARTALSFGIRGGGRTAGGYR